MSSFCNISAASAKVKLYIIENKMELFKQFMLAFLLISWCYIGLLSVNYFFSDDIVRFPNSNRGWVQDGRYIMHGIYQFLTMNFGESIASASSYTYFLTTFVLALNTLIIAIYFNKKNIYISIVISSLVVITPFYWYWMLYVHDRLPMSISLFIAIITAIFAYNIGYKQRLILQTLVLFGLFFMYQVAMLAFMIMVAFLFCYHLIEYKEEFKTTFNKVINSAVSFIIACVSFKILDKFVDRSVYASNALSVDRLADLSSHLAEIVTVMKNSLLEWSNTSFGYLCLAILVLFTSTMLYKFFKTNPKPMAIILFVFSFILLFLGFITLLLLSNLIHRFFVPFTLIISLSLLYVYNNNHHKILHKIVIVLIVAIIMNCLSMSAYLADYLQKQSEHQMKIGALLEDDIYQVKKDYPDIKFIRFINPQNIIKRVELEDSPIYLPIIRNYLQRFDIYAFPFKLSSILTPFDKNDGTYDHKVDLARLNSGRFNIESPNTKIHIEILDRRYYKINYYPNRQPVTISGQKIVLNTKYNYYPNKPYIEVVFKENKESFSVVY